MRLLSVLLMSMSLTPLALAQDSPFEPFAQKSFSDVPTTHVSFEAIESLRERNILQGYPDGTFKPGNRINRAEFVFLITNPLLMDTNALNECLRNEQVKDSQTAYYPDVDRAAWYAAAVCHATQKGLIKGYPDGRFQPGEYINFAEAAKILSSAMALQTTEEPTEQWFRPYVTALSEQRAIPVSIKSFDQILTRSEMAEMLYRLRDDITDREYRDISTMK
jgi:hypothetical protein